MKPIAILQFVNVLNFGGGEGQFIERVRNLDRRRWRPLVATMKSYGPHLRTLQEMGLPPREIPMGSTLAHPATAMAVAKLTSWMREEKVRLVHAQDFYTNLIAIPAAKLAGAKVVVSRLDLSHHHDPRHRQALALASRLADCVQANAEAIRRQVIDEDGVSPARTAVVMNGIDLARFDRSLAEPLASPLPVPEGARLVTVLANLHPVKRQIDAVQAVADLAARIPELHLLLVGEGSQRGIIEEKARSLGIERRVHAVGHRLDVGAILARTEVLVSCSSAEGLSNAIIEGMAARLPVIATSVGGSVELIEDGVRGVLVPPGDPAALARALERVLGDGTLRRRLGIDARAHVERTFDSRLMTKAFDDLYERILGYPLEGLSRRGPVLSRATV